MSKEGSLSRIAKYKESGNANLLAICEAFHKEHYGSAEPKVEVKATPKKAKE